jgi:hypothetical protein
MKGGTMFPDDLKLPKGDFITNANPPYIDKIWRILWVMDPAILKRFGPEVIDDVREIYIGYQIRAAEVAIELRQIELNAMRQMQEKLQKQIR